MKKISTEAMNRIENFKGQQLTIGLGLGDRFRHYCILGESGEVIGEHNLPTTPKGIDEVFGRIPRSRIALETGTHSPWASRQLTRLGHEVIVAHANRNDGYHDRRAGRAPLGTWHGRGREVLCGPGGSRPRGDRSHPRHAVVRKDAHSLWA